MTPEYEDDGDVTVFHHDLGSGSTIDNENGHIVAFDPLVRIMFSNFSFFIVNELNREQLAKEKALFSERSSQLFRLIEVEVSGDKYEWCCFGHRHLWPTRTAVAAGD